MDQPRIGYSYTGLPHIDFDLPTRKLSAFFPSRATRARAPGRAKALKVGLFIFFVLTRALHEVVIDISKVNGTIMYAKNTPVAMNKVLTVLLMNTLAFVYGGREGIRACWQPQCLMVFGLIGVIYALGDFFETLSMVEISGGVYHVLLETKLIITACLLWWLQTGSKLTPLQWHVLFAMFLAMSSFVVLDVGSSLDHGTDAGIPSAGVACVMLKVAVSCYCAVLLEKYLKAYSEMPLFAKISALSTTWALASMMLCKMEPQVSAEGFFANWDGMTWMVTCSFVVKTVSTMYLLQARDSVQKAIGEALAIVVIYLSSVAFPGAHKPFELSVSLLAVLMVALVRTYLVNDRQKKQAEREKKALQSAGTTKRHRVVALKNEATPLMTTMGCASTVQCEIAEATKEHEKELSLLDKLRAKKAALQEELKQLEERLQDQLRRVDRSSERLSEDQGLPDGVWYGMLGDAHPVCGSTNPKSKTECELIMLEEAPDAMPKKKAPYMPTPALMILGHIRDFKPRNQLLDDQYVWDCDAARHKLVERCSGFV